MAGADELTATFGSEQQVQRLIYLAHRDLCRVEGSIVLAQEKLDNDGINNEKRLPGNVRKRAEETVNAGPKEATVLEDAIEALRECLRKGREAGVVG